MTISSSGLILLATYTYSYTRARGADTPHFLDLVILNNLFVNEISHLAPLGYSDHVCLEISWNFDFDKLDNNFGNGRITCSVFL